jgi:hypothetical protein
MLQSLLKTSGPKKKIIHVMCFLCCCKHEVAFEKYKLKI